MIISRVPLGVDLLGGLSAATRQPVVLGISLAIYDYAIAHQSSAGLNLAHLNDAGIIAGWHDRRLLGQIQARQALENKLICGDMLHSMFEAYLNFKYCPLQSIFSANGGLRLFDGQHRIAPPKLADSLSKLLILVDGIPNKDCHPDKQETNVSAMLAEQGFDAVLHEDWQKLGKLMDKEMKMQNATPDNSRLYMEARLNGAYGGKIVGDNLLVMLAPVEKHEKIRQVFSQHWSCCSPKCDFSGANLLFQTF